VLLHGFAGTRRAWDLVAGALDAETYRPLALDLRGHGAANAARPIAFDACVADVVAAAPPGRFDLCGYSMGARLALHVALAAPAHVRRLVLVAGTAGLEDAADRAARVASDEALARFADGASIEAFAERWQAQALFAGDPPSVAARAREDILRNDPRTLAAVLRAIGTGRMAPLWDRLGELRMPVTVVAGERDEKFVALGERLAAALPRARMVVVPRAGHRLALEDPRAVTAAIADGARAG
jgi:2-succinyl-6-hydroxy-2,4-cyclohexadiene-1-carboxylate synthase